MSLDFGGEVDIENIFSFLVVLFQHVGGEVKRSGGKWERGQKEREEENKEQEHWHGLIEINYYVWELSSLIGGNAGRGWKEKDGGVIRGREWG